MNDAQVVVRLRRLLYEAVVTAVSRMASTIAVAFATMLACPSPPPCPELQAATPPAHRLLWRLRALSAVPPSVVAAASLCWYWWRLSRSQRAPWSCLRGISSGLVLESRAQSAVTADTRLSPRPRLAATSIFTVAIAPLSTTARLQQVSRTLRLRATCQAALLLVPQFTALVAFGVLHLVTWSVALHGAPGLAPFLLSSSSLLAGSPGYSDVLSLLGAWKFTLRLSLGSGNVTAL